MRTLFATLFVVTFAACLFADTDKGATEDIERLVRQLGDESFEVREKASEAIVKIGIAALPLLEKAAKAEDAEVRIRASKAIEAIKASPDYLSAALKGGTPASRREAAEKMGRQGPAAKAAVPALVKLLDDADESVRDAAVDAIIRIEPTSKAIAKFVPEKAHVSGKYKTPLRASRCQRTGRTTRTFTTTAGSTAPAGSAMKTCRPATGSTSTRTGSSGASSRSDGFDSVSRDAKPSERERSEDYASRLTLALLMIQRDIQRLHRVGQRADADAIDARLRQRSHRGECDAARRFKQYARRVRVAPFDRLAKHHGVHVIQQDHVGSARQGAVELLERVHLDFQR